MGGGALLGLHVGEKVRYNLKNNVTVAFVLRTKNLKNIFVKTTAINKSKCVKPVKYFFIDPHFF